MPMVDQWTKKEDASLWTEKYRPKTINDCILPDFKKQELLHMLKQNDIPNLLLHGKSGIGKTTVAKALCDEMECDWIMLNGSDIGLDMHAFKTQVKNFASTCTLYGGRKIIIIDEADNMSTSTMMYLRYAMEEFHKNCRFIFTCNYVYKIMQAIQSRCSVYEFNISKDDEETIKTQFIDRACEILDSENIPHYISTVVKELVEKYFPDFRRVLNELQKHSNSGSIDEKIMVKTNCDDSVKLLFDTLRTNSFDGVRLWTHTHYQDMEPVDFYRVLYDSLDDHFDKSQRQQATIKLNDYCYKSSAVQDQELNMIACLTELMEIINPKE